MQCRVVHRVAVIQTHCHIACLPLVTVCACGPLRCLTLRIGGFGSKVVQMTHSLVEV